MQKPSHNKTQGPIKLTISKPLRQYTKPRLDVFIKNKKRGIPVLF